MTDIEAEDEGFVLENYISWRAFGGGLAFFGIVTVLLIFLCWFNADATFIARQDRLESITVLIERTEKPAHLVEAEKKEPEIIPPVFNEPVKAAETFKDLETYENGNVKAPVPGLYVSENIGNIPVIRQDGLSAFQAYRKPYDFSSIPGAKAIVSLVVVDFGLSDPASEAAIKKMPADVTFLMSPYAGKPDEWREKARSDGHELWLSLPLEPEDPLENDTGSLTLMTDTALDVNLQRLGRILGRTTGYTGVVATRDTIFYKSDIESREIINSILNRGLAYADASTDIQPLSQAVSLSSEKPYVQADIWIDDYSTPDSIQQKLEDLMNMAIDRGYAVGFLRPLPSSMEAIHNWIPGLRTQNILLAPLSVQTWKRPERK